MPSNDFVKKIIRKDRKTFFNDYKLSQSKKTSLSDDNGDDYNKKSLKPLISDFTEYNPLHNGHFHCLKIAKKHVPDGIFVAVVPGLFERSGRGLPYILHRRSRAEMAVNVGADIVVEGPPMGIMGSGQYSLCLCKMFQALNTDYIPRGYISNDPKFKIILNYINNGKGVAPKPYKIISMEDKKVLLEGKLSNDDYVIVL